METTLGSALQNKTKERLKKEVTISAEINELKKKTQKKIINRNKIWFLEKRKNKVSSDKNSWTMNSRGGSQQVKME